jgi:hypothetical protein
MADIRHAAVHRIRVSARGIEQFIRDAESLAALLENDLCQNKLTRLRRETQMVTEEFERNKHVLGSKLDDTLNKIALERAKLDRLEEAAIEDMAKEDKEYQNFAGTSLEEAIMDSKMPMVVAEDDMTSDVDDTDSLTGSEQTSLPMVRSQLYNEVDLCTEKGEHS